MKTTVPLSRERGNSRNPIRKITAHLQRCIITAALPLTVLATMWACAPTANAQVTYNLTQVQHADNITPSNTDTFSGTLTISSIGAFTSSNDSGVTLSYTFSMSSSSGSISPITTSGSVALSSAPLFQGTLTATGSTLTLSSNGNLELESGTGIVGNPYDQAAWEPQSTAYNMFAGIQGSAATMQEFNNSVGSTPFGSPNWALGTAVPEPTSATLTMIGGLGLLMARRRRAA